MFWDLVEISEDEAMEVESWVVGACFGYTERERSTGEPHSEMPWTVR